jgi:fibronectin-binding autotransporter adhesin
MKFKKLSLFAWSSIGLPSIMILGSGAHAAEIAYKSTLLSTDAEATTATNWVGNIAPGTGDIATWLTDSDPVLAGQQESRGGIITVGSPVSWQGIRHNDSNGALTLTGSAITLGSSGIVETFWENLTIENPVVLGADQSWNPAFNTLNVTGVISGPQVLTKGGGGTLTLGNTNTYGGGTFVRQGILALNFDAATAPVNDIIPSSAPFTLGGGTLRLNGKSGGTNSQSISSLNLAAGTSSTISLVEAGGGSTSIALSSVTRPAATTLSFILPSNGSLIAALPDGFLRWGFTGSGSSTSFAQVSSNLVSTFLGDSVADHTGLVDTTGTANYEFTNATGTVGAGLAANTILYFGGAATTTPNTSISVNTLLHSGSGAWTIGAGTLTAGAEKELIINAANSSVIVNAVIADHASGASSLVKAGGNGLTLAAANTYTGGTVLSSGTTTATNAAAFGLGSITAAGNPSLVHGIGANITNNITINAASNLNVSGGFRSLTGVISGAGSLTSNGTIQLTNTNTYTGKTFMTGGLLCFNADAALGAVPASFDPANITISNGGGFSNYLAGSTQILNANRGITLNAGLQRFDVANQFLRIDGVISGVGGISKTSTATLSLQGNNTYTGGTTIGTNSGEIRSDMRTGTTVKLPGTYTPFGTGTVTVNSGSTLRFFTGSTSNDYTIANNINLNSATLAYEDGNHTLPGNIAMTGANTFNGVWGDKKLISSGVISGSGSLIHTGSSTMTVGGANTYTGSTSARGGILGFSTVKNVGDATGSSFGNVADATIGTIALGSGTSTGTISYIGVGSSSNRNLDLAGTNGGGTITQSGTGLLSFSGTNSASGLGSKTLTLNGSTAGTGELTSAIVDNGTLGTTSLAATFALAATTVTLSSVEGVTVGAAISGTGIAPGTTVSAVNTGTRVVTLSAAATAASGAVGSGYTVTGVRNITSLTKGGTGTWSLGGTNTYTGNTTINNGVLAITGTGQLGAGTYAGTTTIASGASLNYASSVNQTFTGALNGAGGLTKSTSSILTLSAGGNLSGPVALNGGSIILTNNGALGTSTVSAATGTILQIANGAAGQDFSTNINFNGGKLIASDFTFFYGAMNLGSGDQEVEVPNYFATWVGGRFTGTGNLVKTGIGSLVCHVNGAVWDHTGETKINAGTFQMLAGTPVTLSATSAISVASGATIELNLSERFNNAASLSVAGTFRLNGTATETVASASFASTGSLALSVNTTAGTTGQLISTGAVSLGNAALMLTQNNPGTLALGTKITLIDYTGGSVTGTFNGLPEGAFLTLGSNDFKISYVDSSKVTLTAAVPGGYSSWAASNVGGGPVGGDHDFDGVSNGVEYFMNAPAGFTANPTLDEFDTITWVNGGNINSSAYGTEFVVQTSPDLTTWNDEPLENVTNTAGSVSYTLSGPGPKFVRLLVAPN